MFVLACGNNQPVKETPEVQSDFPFPYDLENPTQKFSLPVRLTEVSGLCYAAGDKVMAVQDEKGKYYTIDAQTGEVDDGVKYTDPGDFEGIALVNDDLYTLRADGKIYRIKSFGSDDPETKKYKTHLEEKNDAEGLCYDAANNRLLVVAKGHPGKKDSKGQKSHLCF